MNFILEQGLDVWQPTKFSPRSRAAGLGRGPAEPTKRTFQNCQEVLRPEKPVGLNLVCLISSLPRKRKWRASCGYQRCLRYDASTTKNPIHEDHRRGAAGANFYRPLCN